MVKRDFRLDARFSRRYCRSMIKPADIIDSLGQDAIAERLGVAPSRVRRVRHEPLIPAAWYAGLSEMAGHDLPREVFAFAPRRGAA